MSGSLVDLGCSSYLARSDLGFSKTTDTLLHHGLLGRDGSLTAFGFLIGNGIA